MEERIGFRIDADTVEAKKHIKEFIAELKKLRKQMQDTDGGVLEDDLAELKEDLLDARTEMNALTEATLEASKNTKTGFKDAGAEIRKAGDIAKEAGQEINRGFQQSADSTFDLKSRMREVNQQLAQLALNGQKGTEEYQKLLAEAGNIKDAMMDVGVAIKNSASDTVAFDRALSGLNTGVAGVQVLTGAMSAFGLSSENATKAQEKLTALISMTTGLQNIQNNLQEQSALMQGVMALKTKALAMAENMKTVATGKGIVATKAATIAQKAFNAVANMNPYVIIASGIGLLAGAFFALSKDTEKATDSLESYEDKAKKVAELNIAIKKGSRELEELLTNANDFSADEQRSIVRRKKIVDDLSNTTDAKERQELYNQLILEQKKFEIESEKRRQAYLDEYARQTEENARREKKALNDIQQERAKDKDNIVWYYDSMSKATQDYYSKVNQANTDYAREMHNAESEGQRKIIKTQYDRTIADIEDWYDAKKRELQAKKDTILEINNTIKQLTKEIQANETYGGQDEYGKSIFDAEKALKSKLDSIDELQRKAPQTEKISQLFSTLREQANEQYVKTVLDIESSQVKAMEEVASNLDDVLISSKEKELKEIDEWAKERKEKLKSLNADAESLKMIDDTAELKKAQVNYKHQTEQAKAFAEQQKRIIENDSKLNDEEKQEKMLEIDKAMYKSLIDIAKVWKTILEEQGASAEKLAEINTEIQDLSSKADNPNPDSTKKIANEWKNVSSSIKGVSSSLKGLDTQAGQIASAFADMGSALADAFAKQKEGAKATTADYIGAASVAIDTAIQFYEANKRQHEENKRQAQEWQKIQEESAKKAALSRIEAWEYQKKNIFGIDDPYAEATASVKKYYQAQKELNEYQEKFNKGMVQTDTKIVSDKSDMVKSMATGMAAGATVGSVINVGIGTAVGALVGGVAGLLSSVLGSSKTRVAVYESIKSVYGQIYDAETFELNQRILDDYDKMDDATKQLIDNWEEIKDKMKEAKDELESVIKDLAGDLGNQLLDSILGAFKSGDIRDAIKDFKGYITRTMEELYMDKIADKIFGTAFTNLQKSMEQSIGFGTDKADGSWIDDLQNFFYNISPMIKSAENAMDLVQKQAQQAGFDIFGKDTSSSQNLIGTASSMTAEQADALNGNFLGLKMTAMEINSKLSQATDIIQSSLSVQRQIADNTAFCERLVDIETALNHMDRVGVKAL